MSRASTTLGCEYDRSVNDIHITPAKSIILLVDLPDATSDADAVGLQSLIIESQVQLYTGDVEYISGSSNKSADFAGKGSPNAGPFRVCL